MSPCKETLIQVCGGPLPVDVHAATSVAAKRAAVKMMRVFLTQLGECQLFTHCLKKRIQCLNIVAHLQIPFLCSWCNKQITEWKFIDKLIKKKTTQFLFVCSELCLSIIMIMMIIIISMHIFYQCLSYSVCLYCYFRFKSPVLSTIKIETTELMPHKYVISSDSRLF